MPISGTKELYIYKNQINRLFTQAKSEFVINTANVLILCYALWSVNEVFTTLIIWACLMVVVQFARITAYCLYKKSYILESDTHFWFKIYSVIFYISMVLWGVASYFLFVPNSFQYQMILVIVISSVVAGGVLMLSAYRFFSFIFPVFILLPLSVRLILTDHELGYVIGIILIIYIVILRAAAEQMHNMFVDSIELQYELKKLAHFDALTSIANRRNFDTYLETELSRASRNKSNLALLLIDIDHFKLYNDNYGHQQGDKCLVEVVDAIKPVLRRSADLLARYGGEEFAVILPETDANGAKYIANAIQNALEFANIPHKYSPTVDRVTISIGIAVQKTGDNVSSAELIAEADANLYFAKEHGRNQIIFANH